MYGYSYYELFFRCFQIVKAAVSVPPPGSVAVDVSGIRFPTLDNRFEVIGQLAVEADLLAGRGVYEPECSGMQGMSGHYGETVFDELPVFRECGTLEYAVSAISFVVEKRVPDMLHVDSDLMGATGFELAFDQCDISESFEYTPVCYGMFAFGAVGVYGHLETVASASADISDNCTLVLVEISPDQSGILPDNGVVEELFCQAGVSEFIFCDHEQSGGILVDTVDKSGTHVSLLE